MKILTTKVGLVHTNCYIVFDEATKKAVAIDPGEKGQYLLELIKENGLTLEYIFITHSHFDHILAVKLLQDQTGATPVLHKKESYGMDESIVNKHFGKYIRGNYQAFNTNEFAKDGSLYSFGNLTAKFIHTPGHSKGSCVIQIEDCLFTGDTLFAGECGRCDLEGGDFGEMLLSLNKLANLDGDYKVYPGHEQSTTLNHERKTNRYMLQAQGL